MAIAIGKRVHWELNSTTVRNWLFKGRRRRRKCDGGAQEVSRIWEVKNSKAGSGGGGGGGGVYVWWGLEGRWNCQCETHLGLLTGTC